MGVLVFGGTSEGRELAQWLAQSGLKATVCTATAYGGQLVSGLPGVEVREGRLDEAEILQLMQELTSQEEALSSAGPGPGRHGSGSRLVVVDATHPYAVEVSANIRSAAAAAGATCLRLVRDGADASGEWVEVPDVHGAIEALNKTEGRVLLTTGSKDLAAFVHGVRGAATRLFVRVLPAAESLLIAHELGVPMDHIIAMQGPFSKQLNCALIDQLGIGVMVTKASGARGGFWEKAAAARERGIELVVIARPVAEEGLSLAEVKHELSSLAGAS